MTDKERLRVGEALRALRVSKRLKQRDVASVPKGEKHAGVSMGTLQMIEKGQGREVRDSNIRKVARFLGTTIEECLKVDVAPGDPRLTGLLSEDLRIARQYHDSATAVRHQVQFLLEEGEDGKTLALLEALRAAPPDTLSELLPIVAHTIEAVSKPSVDDRHNLRSNVQPSADDGPRRKPKLSHK